MLHRDRDIAHQAAEFLGQPVQRRGDHLLETAGFDLDHQPIVQHSAAPASPGADRPALIALPAAEE